MRASSLRSAGRAFIARARAGSVAVEPAVHAHRVAVGPAARKIAPTPQVNSMTARRAVHPIAMCRMLGVSRGCYAWRQRLLSRRARADVKSSAEIQAIGESRGTYGVPRIPAELAEPHWP